MYKMLLVLTFTATLVAQSNLFNIEVKEVSSAQTIPALHSFSLGEYDNEWLIVGGLTHGTHGDGKQVFASGQFPHKNFNQHLWVISPSTGQVWSSKIDSELAKTIHVANPQYCQIDDETLCIVGGYGFNEKQHHDTLGVMTWIDIPQTIHAIKKGQPFTPTQIFDERLRVTGGELKYIDGEFFLVAGQKFVGKYMSDEKQKYTLQIRRFQVDQNTWKINNYQAIGEESLHIRTSNTVSTLANKKRYTHDLDSILPPKVLRTIRAHGKSLDSYLKEGNDGKSHLRRRDLNVTEAFFPDGSRGFVLYGGGFKFSFPMFSMHQNPIFFSTNQQFSGCHAMIDMSFEQTMSLYTCAHMLVFDTQKRSMHTVLFGGISAFTFDDIANEAVRDRMLPYVNNISIETISGSKNINSWRSKETVIKKNNRAQIFGQQGFFGTNSKFILNDHGKKMLHSVSREVLDLQKLRQHDKDLPVGYIYGGIHALKQNFGKTKASNTIFGVYVKVQN